MSTDQQTKPRCANQSITDESARPGTDRSNVGCDAIDDPCTNSTAGLASGDPTYFSQRNSRTSPSAVGFVVQCSTPVIGELLAAGAATCASIVFLVSPAIRIQSTFAPVSRTTLAHRSFSARKKR